jgi:hypothetical protein
MYEGEQRDIDTIWLLRTLTDQVMAQKGLEDEEDVVGVPVAPATAQIDLSPTRYEAAMEQLRDMGALARDRETDEANELLSSAPGSSEMFKITSVGIDVLREMGM